MPTKSWTDNFGIVDLTESVQLVPNSWTVLSDAGLFETESITTRTVTFEEFDGSLGYLRDQVRGARQQVNKDDLRRIHSYATAHVPVQDQVTAAELSGKRAYGSDAFDTADAAIARKVARIRKNYDMVWELAKWRTLTTGNVWSPNGTISGNFYTDFGATPVTVDFLLSTAGTEINEKVQEAVAESTNKLSAGNTPTGFIAYVSTGFFNKLIKHPKVVAAYNQYASVAEPLRNGLRLEGNNGNRRTFVHAGILFVEVPFGGVDGAPYLAVDSGILVPQGTEGLFKTYVGPAEKFGIVNTLGEPLYMWQKDDENGESIKVMAESNFLHALLRPACVVRLTTSN